MPKQEIIKIFGDRKIRSVWDDEAEIWYFSIVDVVAVLTESVNPANYWKVLKNRLKKEGNETVTNCNHLKLRAADGKRYNVIFHKIGRAASNRTQEERLPRPCSLVRPSRNGTIRYKVSLRRTGINGDNIWDESLHGYSVSA